CQRQSGSRTDVAAHGNAGNAKSERRREFLEHVFSTRAAGIAVCDQSDAMATRNLFACEIEHMTEQTADRRAEDVQYVQGRHCRAHTRSELEPRIERIPGQMMRNPRWINGLA